MVIFVNAVGKVAFAEIILPTQPLDPVREIEVSLNDNYFNPNDINLKAEKPVTLNLKNNGKKPHSFTIKDLKIDVELQPGETKKLTLRSPNKGTYELICRFHQSEGMVGKVIVK
ncbi:cupredoxin domain-containing protein [Bacillus sp. P1(2020)]|uniref:Cupredoxin domain-containing protein n=2 Tax=Pallidibacillus pasinlerensis TaxID=2703818 RepID=A0ABX0A5Z4_9BACI|nr:cupredoxin domain-containing protein [Pallidibacillus pasinlerensis]